MNEDSIIICKNEGHNQQILQYFCINKNCAETTCCNDCLKEMHQSHIRDCLEINQLHQKIEENLKTEFQRMSEQAQNLQNLIEEKNEKIMKELKNTFKNETYSLINCKEYLKNRKCQILHFLEISNYFGQRVLDLKKSMSEIDEQVEIITEKIKDSQIQMKVIKEQFIRELQEKQLKEELERQKLQNQNKNIKQNGNYQQLENSNSINQQEQQVIQRKITFLDSYESESESNNEEVIESEQQIENVINEQEIELPLEDIIQKDEVILDYQEYLDLKKQLLKTQSLYTDSTTNNLIFESSQNIKRISQIFQQPINFFCSPHGQNVFASDGITVQIKDIIQSHENEDFFLDLMYYIASFCPQELKNVFITKEYSPQGIYAIKLNDTVNYESEIITKIVDDYIPQTFNILSCKQICFLILKKAIAKLFGGFYKFRNFRYLMTVSSLFDCVQIILYICQDKFLEKVKEEIACQSLILVDFIMDESYQENRKVYQILDLIEVKNLFDEIIVLFKIKTSQSRYEYNGEWGFLSPFWTDDMKLQLQISEEDDGIIFMDFISFAQKTEMLYSVRIKQKLLIHQYFILRSNQGAYFSLDLNEDQNLAFWFNLNENEDIQNKYFFFKAIISHAQTFSLEKSVIVLKTVRFAQLLRKGKYIVYLKCPSFHRQTLQCMIQIHGAKKIEFNQIQKIENYKPLVFEQQIEKVGRNFLENQLFLAKNLNLETSGWKIYKFYNKSQNSLKFQIKLGDCNHYQFCKPHSKTFIQQMIQKGKNILVIIKTLPGIKNCHEKPLLEINDEMYEL